LKELLALAKDVVAAEEAVEPEEERDRAKAALTDLFDWQDTEAGKREVRRVLRSTLLRYKLHHDQDLFERAYGYVEQYY
jgi:type I restriction enzyme R subunit